MEANEKTKSVQLSVGPDITVSARIGTPEWWPSGHRAAVVLAHDLGGTHEDPLLTVLQERLIEKGFLSISFNFPFAEAGKKRPDPMPVLEKAYRTASQALMRDPEEAPSIVVFAGLGLGARVAAHAISVGAKADGLICLSFPLHPAGKPSQQKAESLFRIICPMLFVQGSRDAHCRVDRLESLRRRIGAPTQLVVIEDADHSLGPVKRTKRTADEITAQTLAAVEGYLARTIGG